MLCLTRGSITSVPLSMLFHAWDSCPMCSCLKSRLRLLGRMLLLPVPQACGAKGPTLPGGVPCLQGAIKMTPDQRQCIRKVHELVSMPD